jgi:acetate kinase
MGDSIAKRLVEQNGKQSNGRMTSGSSLLCLVIPTNEELMIAKNISCRARFLTIFIHWCMERS